MKSKNYITKAYIDMLKNKDVQTGLYFNTPKVVIKGDKYRKTLKPIEKLIYMEMWDLAMKAAYKGQFDKNGNVYVEVSYAFLATAIGADDSTVERAITKYRNLFITGLIAFKKKNNRAKHEYYVMAPVYEGADELLLSVDQATWDMRKDVQKFADRKNSNRSTKRQAENKVLEVKRNSDIPHDTAEFKHRYKVDTPDFEDKATNAPVESYEELMKKIKKIGIKFNKEGYMDKLVSIVEKHFGVGGKITEASEEELDKMQTAYLEMEEVGRSYNILFNAKKVIVYTNSFK